MVFLKKMVALVPHFILNSGNLFDDALLQKQFQTSRTHLLSQAKALFDSYRPLKKYVPTLGTLSFDAIQNLLTDKARKDFSSDAKKRQFDDVKALASKLKDLSFFLSNQGRARHLFEDVDRGDFLQTRSALANRLADTQTAEADKILYRVLIRHMDMQFFAQAMPQKQELIKTARHILSKGCSPVVKTFLTHFLRLMRDSSQLSQDRIQGLLNQSDAFFPKPLPNSRLLSAFSSGLDDDVTQHPLGKRLYPSEPSLLRNTPASHTKAIRLIFQFLEQAKPYFPETLTGSGSSSPQSSSGQQSPVPFPTEPVSNLDPSHDAPVKKKKGVKFAVVETPKEDAAPAVSKITTDRQWFSKQNKLLQGIDSSFGTFLEAFYTYAKDKPLKVFVGNFKAIGLSSDCRTQAEITVFVDAVTDGIRNILSKQGIMEPIIVLAEQVKPHLDAYSEFIATAR